MNESTRAWNLLKPEERPEGMVWNEFDLCFMDGDPSGPTCDHEERNSYEARDRLIVAVEDVLHKHGTECDITCAVDWTVDEGWTWGVRGIGRCQYFTNPDRLTAANDALEAIRKDDDA